MYCAGIDEAGRGPLAGPVFAAAVILDPDHKIHGLQDSKKLTAKKREQLAVEIKQKAIAWHVASANVTEIDNLNILGATMLAMLRAYKGLAIKPNLVLIDGNRTPQGMDCETQAIIKGDSLHDCIAAASILAKTYRDDDCLSMHEQYPVYGFDKHKGYGTKYHLEMLNKYGACPQHRNSFAPVRLVLNQ